MTALLLEKKLGPITARDLKYLETDKSAVRAIAQAAINVELFTIPLYMVSLYSIQGTHPINTKDITYFKGRLWPGSATTADPKTKNQKAFNTVFAVFVQEMLHLQMAANLAKAIGVQPCFTSHLLQNEDHSWTCYGDDKTVIPHIIDLKDTINYSDVKVNLDSLNKEQIKLFLAIEQTLEDAKENIKPEAKEKYFHDVPFANWSPDKTEIDLPMFGSIGWLYHCYAKYLSIEYLKDDGTTTTLWEEVWEKDISLQKDMFNYTNKKSHPKKEFPKFDPALQQKEDTAKAFNEAIDMMSAITDQGEGSTIDPGKANTLDSQNTISLARWKKNLPSLQATELVEEKYRPSKEALEADYPAYTDTGKPAPSRDAEARYTHSAVSHYDRFERVQTWLDNGDIVTWEQWHDDGNTWTAEMLITTPDYNLSTDPPNIPKPEEVAGALNRLKQNDTGSDNYALVSKAAVGAIAGITTVLNNYWQDTEQDFPYPSMVGSGDRVSICWAIFGKAPNLSLGIGTQDDKLLYHACQGLDITDPSSQKEAPVEVFHSCRGSNQCKAQSGCGFAQLEDSGGNCRAMRVTGQTIVKGGDILCGSPTKPYSPPAANKCKGHGGCAVPISASQLFPKNGEMNIYNFVGDQHKPEQISTMNFQIGDNVYDKAWEAYSKVMEARGQAPGEKPKPSDLRLAFPPST